jgi:hypothetical protein
MRQRRVSGRGISGLLRSAKMRVFGLQKLQWKMSSAVQAYRHLHSLLVKV